MKTMKIIKRSGQEMTFDITKIEDVIRKASAAVDYHDTLSEGRIKLIANEVAGVCAKTSRPVREPREVRFRNAVSAMIRHNRRIRDNIRKVTPFYQGDGSTPVPASKYRIETLINPKRNGACNLLEEFGEACKAYRRGECPHDPLHRLQGSTMSLVEDELEPAFRHKALHISVTVVTDFYNYLLTPNTRTTDEEHARNIDEHVARLQRRFCQNADAFYDRTSELMSRRHSPHFMKCGPSTPARNPRKGSGLHGKRTRAKADELTQSDVARDFGVSRQQVCKWETCQTVDGPSNTSNEYGYYKSLRTDPKLRDAYTVLANQAKMHNKLIAETKKKGGRYKIAFVQFQEQFLAHNKRGIA